MSSGTPRNDLTLAVMHLETEGLQQALLAGHPASDPAARIHRHNARWVMLGIFCLISGVNAMLWISISSVSTTASAYYGVSLDTIDFLPVVFYILPQLLGVGFLFSLGIIQGC